MVIYARYSSDNQREESIEGQIRECTKYAEYNDIEIVGQYIDRAFSAKMDDRPDFFANGFYRNIERIGTYFRIITPYLVHNLLTRQNLPRIAHKKLHYLTFPRT